MNTTSTKIIRTATICVATVGLVATIGATSASARQYPYAGGPARDRYAHQTEGRYHLERIGDQLVKGDFLTGNGVEAPLTVPQQS